MYDTGLVRKVNIRYGRMLVRYYNSILDEFNFASDARTLKAVKIDQICAKKLDEAPLAPEFESDSINGQTTAHVAICRKAYKRCSPIGRAITRQRFIETFMRLGYLPRLPEHVITSDYERLLSRRVQPQDRLLCCSSLWAQLSAFRFFGHFFDLDSVPVAEDRRGLTAAIASPTLVNNAVLKLDRRGFRISSSMVACTLNRKHGPRLAPAQLYEGLFQALGVSGSVFDPHPHLGAKAMACARAGLAYVTADERFDAALNRGFGDRIGLCHCQLAGTADWAIIDWNFAEFDYERALAAYAGKSRRLALYVPARQRAIAMRMCRPAACLDMYAEPGICMGHWFVW